MEQFRSIEEILSGLSTLTGTADTPKTDRVLKSTRIEQAIFDDLSGDADELASYEEQGSKKLKSFGSLVNDVFQSVYGLRPRYTDESQMTTLSMHHLLLLVMAIHLHSNLASLLSFTMEKMALTEQMEKTVLMVRMELLLL